MTAKTRSEIGRSANARGKTYERQLAGYLRSWWPEAERAVAVGFASRFQRAAADPGDIRGVPGVIWDCKSRQKPLSHQQRADLLLELLGKSIDNRVDVAVLVERRERAQVPDWVATLSMGHLTRLAAGPFQDHFVLHEVATRPVSLRLADAVSLLRAYGI